MFNKVKTIGFLSVGLLVMLLGTKAEAHYVYASGTYYYHSVGCEATIGSLSNPPDPLIVECVVTAVRVDARCPDLSIVSLPIQVSLTAQVQIVPGQTQVEVIVPDTSLLNNGNIIIACGGTPNAVLIRDMVSTVTIQCVGPSASCPAPLVTTGTATATCTLPYDFGDYPPPITPPFWEFNCTPPVVTHIY